MKGPFEKSISSVFVVATPFQALCAVAAIKNLEISRYIILAVLHGGIRDFQLIRFLDNMKKSYKPFRYTRARLIAFYLKALWGFGGRYERLFCGYFGSSYMLGIGLHLVKSGSPIVYIDDGNSVVSFLMNTYKLWDSPFKRNLMNILAIRKRSHALRNFYTMYSDIENNLYNVAFNDITSIWRLNDKKKDVKNVVIIGTTIGGYCSQMRMSEDSFVEKLKELFESIGKVYNVMTDHVIYIPHGGDRSVYAEELCREFGYMYRKVDTMVEDYLISESWIPKVVIGFCSTSLMNVRRIMPSVDVRNVFIHMNINNPFQEKYVSIVEYYKQNGIPCKEVVVEQ